MAARSATAKSKLVAENSEVHPATSAVGNAEVEAEPNSASAGSAGDGVSPLSSPASVSRSPNVIKNVEPAKGEAQVVDKRTRKTIDDGRDAALDEPATVAETPAVFAESVARVAEAPRTFTAQAAAPAPVKPVVKAATPVKGQGFKSSDFIVYPAHGVGQIVAIEEQVVAGYKLELFVISFSKDKMILKVPLPKVTSVGMRKLAEPPVVKRALDTLTGRARVKRTMWSRRAQEYEAKINSGDLIAIAEVVRDLYRSDAQPEQSYSERQLYEAALDRIARELSVVQKLTDSEALKLIDGQLQKGPRRGKPEDADAVGDDLDESDEPGIVEAA